MRLFIALYPSKEFLDYARDLWRALDKEKRNILPVPLEQMHLTARFVGANVSVSSKQRIAKALLLRAGDLPKPEIKVEALHMGFKHQIHPKVMFLEIADSPELKDLVNDLHRVVRNEDLKDTILWKANELHDYHITLGRLKPSAVTASGIRKVKELIKNNPVPFPPPFTAEEIYLVESIVTPRGPVYRKLERIKL